MNVTRLLIELKRRGISLWHDQGKLKAFVPKNEQVTPEEKDFIDGKRPVILDVLEKNGVLTKEDFLRRTIYRDCNDTGTWQLSFAQERLWFIEQYEGGSSAYSVPMAFDLGEDVDMDAFRKSIAAIVARHEVLRTVFRKDRDGNEYQLVLEGPPSIREVRIPGEELSRRLEETIQSVFDLVNRGPLDVVLFHTEKSFCALVNVHHCAFDGWSREIFIRELEDFYLHYTEKRDLVFPDPGLQYRDFALWQREYLAGEYLKKECAFWTQNLDGYETLEFPTDMPRPPHVDYQGDDLHFEPGRELSERLRAMARERGVTLFSVLLSAFYVLLHRYTGQRSLVIGTPAANRNEMQLENLIGFFVNSLALKTRLDPEMTVDDLVARVHENLVEAQKHQDLPFEKLVEALGVEKDQSRHPLFQVMFGVTSFGGGARPLFKPFPLEGCYRPAKFDVSLFVNDTEQGMRGTLNYALRLFERPTMERLARHYCAVLEQVAGDSRCRVREVNVLSGQEYETMVYRWNETDAPYHLDTTLVELFEEQASRAPGAPAVLFRGETLTYRELNERANRLAHTLRRDYREHTGMDISGDTLIGIYMERSAHMPVALLGILKSGAAYVPFDSADPAERLRFKIRDCGCRMVITLSESLRDLVFLAETDTIPLALDGYADEICRAPGTNPPRVNRATDCAYVIYTSGSTGRPKGVMLEHRTVINYVENFRSATAGGAKVFDLSSSLSFDLTVTTTIVPLLTGNTIAVYPGSLKDMGAYMRHIEEKGVTFIKTVPSLLYMLLQGTCPPSLKEIFVGGEKLKRELLSPVEGLAIFDEYGPTEATVGTTLSCVFPRGEKGIGKPYHNYRVYILDPGGRPVPPGVTGELFIGGDCLARGYLNRRSLTEERFVENPFATPQERAQGRNGRIYRTGDLARWLPGGTIEYLGRNDDQVKIRGFRVELGEIEERLSEHPSVEQCAVVCREFNATMHIAAYYVSGTGLSGDEVRAYLQEQLPEYMVPSIILRLDEMPLTANGKVDRRELPEPEFRGDEGGYAPPRTGEEAELCRVWQEVLGIGKVGIGDDFFRLGGTSILAMKLSYRMTQALGREIAVAEIFDRKTVQGIADALPGFRRTAAIGKCAGDTAVLSFAQERLYFIEEYEGGSNAYHIPMLFELGRDCSIEALKSSIGSIVERHEVLRTVFVRTGSGEVRQRVLDRVPEARERHIDGSELHDAVTAEVNALFDLHGAPPVRVIFFFAGSTRYLLVTIHHIAFDGWSTDIFMKELGSFYRFHREGTPPALPGLEIQYRDFAAWQREYLSGDRLGAELEYWKGELEGYETLELPADHPRPPDVDYRGDYYVFDLDRDLSGALRAGAKRYGTTLYALFLSAFHVLLHRYSGQDDIVIGTPTANRPYPQLEHLVGFFVNSTVTRCIFTPGLTLRGLVEKTAQALAAVQAHQDMPFEKLVELLKVPKDPSRHPLIQVMFSVQSFGSAGAQDPGGLFKTLDLSGSYRVSKYDVSLFVDDSRDIISCCFNYATSLFERETMEKMARHYLQLLEHLACREDALVEDLPLLAGSEYTTLVHDWNRTDLPFPREKTIGAFFEEQAGRTPGHTALVFEGKELTYRELNEQANRLARLLQRDYLEFYGSPPGGDTLVGIYMERSLDMIAGILGILKSGAAYVPLDRADPPERLRFKIRDCACRMIVTSTECLGDLLSLAESDTLVISMDGYREEMERQPVTAPPTTHDAGNLAYVIYTSGSTGTPKGVMVEHRGVVNLAVSHAQSFGLGAASRVLHLAPVSFDASVSTLFCTLLNGGTLCISTEEARKDVHRLGEFILSQRITLIDIPAKLLELFPLDLDCTWLGTIITAGEVCDRNTMDYWCDRVTLVNAYGPTESTVCTTFAVHGRERSNTDIGKPVGNKLVYVLDHHGLPVPVGVPGELFIGGEGLARGYLHRPGLTAERFVPDPFAGEAGTGGRLYRTGDVVRWLKDGSLEFLGRNDDQVKLHGYRIELGEVESALGSIEGIGQCAVTVHGQEAHRHLCAYYTASPGVTGDEVRKALSAALPDYMVPSWYVRLERFPLTTSGKIDRRALPAPGVEAPEAGYAPPRTGLEADLCTLFQEVLGLDRVGVDDDFFKIGGDSILSIQLSSALRNAGLECPVRDIFKNSTVAKLAAALARHDREKERVSTEKGTLEGEFGLLPIQRWFFEKVKSGAFPSPPHWNQSFLVRVPALDCRRVSESIKALADFHDMLRATFSGEKQCYHREIGIPPLQLLDRGTLSDEELQEALTRWQSGFDLEHGPLWQAGYIHGYPDGSARIFFSFHHLIIDAVSWRILMEDMARLYGGKPLQEKTSSYRQWVAAIDEYPGKNPDEKGYWEEIAASMRGYGDHERHLCEPFLAGITLGRELTETLIKDVHGAYDTGIHDLMLTAFAFALKDWQGGNRHSITLEGHGREAIDPAIDHSHTVGWFTSVYPVTLEVHDDMGRSIAGVRDSLRRVPRRGVGFGAFFAHDMQRHLPPVTFNYLGQFDSGGRDGMWQLAGEPSGVSIDPANADSSLVAVNGLMVDGRLRFQVATLLGRDVTDRFARVLEESLAAIAAHCTEVISRGARPARHADDFEYIPSILLNREGNSPHLLIMIHPDSGYEAYMATLYPAVPGEVKVIMVDNFYRKAYLKDGVLFQKYHFTCFGDLAGYYVDLLQEEYGELLSRASCSLVGYSFGTPIAIEMDRLFRGHSIAVERLYLIDPLLPALLKTRRELPCFEWYRGYSPAPTPTPTVHFHCTLPDPSLPGYTEYFVDREESSLEALARDCEEIDIESVHTGILTNPDFIRRFREKVVGHCGAGSTEEVAREARGAGDMALEGQVREMVAELLEVNRDFGREVNLFQLGCTSIQTLSLLAMLNEGFHLDLALGDIIHDFTIEGLAAAIARAGRHAPRESDAWEPVIFTSKAFSPETLYFFPGLIGSVSSYSSLCTRLSESFDVVFLEPRGMYGTMVPFATYEEAVSCYAGEVARRSPPGSTLYLAGHSVGAVHSLDVALRLQQEGYTAVNLINIDGYLHRMESVRESIGMENKDEALVAVIRRFFLKGGGMEREPGAGDPLRQIASILFPGPSVSRDYALRVALGYRNVWHQQIDGMLNYHEPPETFRGPALVLVTCESDEKLRDSVLQSCRERYAGQCKTRTLSGDHLSCISRQEHIEELYGHIAAWKDMVEGKRESAAPCT